MYQKSDQQAPASDVKADQETAQKTDQLLPDEWVSFPGGELEGRRPKALCPKCRAAQRSGHSALPDSALRSSLLCFCCYRAEHDRQKAIAAAGQLDTASEARFQIQLPFEPVNRPRLDRLKVARVGARRASAATVAGPFVDKRRHAQMTARRTLQQIAAGLSARRTANAELPRQAERAERAKRAELAERADRAERAAAVLHAAELQLPEAWIPFLMSPSRMRSSVRQ